MKLKRWWRKWVPHFHSWRGDQYALGRKWSISWHDYMFLTYQIEGTKECPYRVVKIDFDYGRYAG